MQNLGSTQPSGRPKKAATAQQRLVDAYRKVFTGHGSKEDAEIVLSDLGVHTGFYQVMPADVTAEQLRFREGQRDAFARILSCLRMSEAELLALEEAARLESITIYEER